MSDMNCDCKTQTDPLHCNKCDHVFCGACQIVFRQIKNGEITGSRKKACPNCLSTDLYIKMNMTNSKDFTSHSRLP